MTLSDELHRWGSVLVECAQGDGVVASIVLGPKEWSNPSVFMTVAAGRAECDLHVWDSGDAEYIRFDGKQAFPRHIDIGIDMSSWELFEMFARAASEVVGKPLALG